MAARLELLIDPSGAESGATRAAAAADKLLDSTDKATAGVDALEASIARLPAATTGLGATSKPVDDLASSYGRLSENLQSIEDVQAVLSSALDRARQDQEEAAATVDATSGSVEVFRRELHDLSGAYGVVREEATSLEAIQAELADSMRAAAEAAEEQRSTIERSSQLTAQQQSELHELEGAYGRTADQADTLEDVHLRLALGMEQERLATERLAGETQRLATESERTGEAVQTVGSRTDLASKSIGKAVDAALGLENVFGKIITRGTYFLGADLIARAVGFNGVLDLITSGLDAIGKGAQEAGASLLNYLQPGFTESAKAASDLEARFAALEEKRAKASEGQRIEVGGQKFDVEDLVGDPELYDRATAAAKRAKDQIEAFQALRSLRIRSEDPLDLERLRQAFEDLEKGLRDQSSISEEFGFANLDLVRGILRRTDAFKSEADAIDQESIPASMRRFKAVKDENDALAQLTETLEGLRARRQANLDLERRIEEDAESRQRNEGREPAAPEQVERADASRFEQFNAQVILGLERREDRERALAEAISDQELADEEAVEASRRFAEHLEILDAFYGRAEDAAQSYQEILENQRNLTRIESLSSRSAREEELDQIEARNLLIQGGIEPAQSLVDLLAREMALRRQMAGDRERTEEASGILEALEAEIAALEAVGPAREHMNDLRRLEALAAADQTGEIQKLLDKYREELDVLEDRSKARIDREKEKAEARAYGEANARAAASAAESWVIGARRAKDAWRDFLEDLYRNAVRRFFTQPIFNAFAPDTQSAHGDLFVGGRLTQMAYGGEMVTSPRIFNGPDGSHMIGEAGPEVVAPVARDAKGNVGVRLLGGDGGGNPTFVFNVSTPNADSFRRSQRHIIEDARWAWGR